MRRIREIPQLFSAAIMLTSATLVGLPATAHASAASEPSLVISQLKITSRNGQFVTLNNTTDTTLDMSQYQLEYFNNYDPNKATSSRVIGLSGIVPPHGYFTLSSGTLALCYQMTVDSLSLGFSSTAGMVRVLNLGSEFSAQSAPALEDYVGWSKTDAAGAQTLPEDSNAFLARQPVDVFGYPLVGAAGAGSWETVQPDPADACGLVSASTGFSITTPGATQLLPSSQPPVTILSAADVPAGLTASLPPADIGLMAPVINELLPNPSGTGNDSTDEFVELYNPNDSVFDLSGFSLQVGTTTLHDYKFPAATNLPPHGFTAFYSSMTGLSLSNSGGQAKLIDPFGVSISTTGVYGSAKDGLAWALANGKWFWTTRPTPGAANMIDQPLVSKPAKTKKTAAKAASKSGTTAKKPKKIKTAKPVSQLADLQAPAAPIHPGVLALVGGAALLYGAYEYRTDLANRVYQFRSYFKARREDRV